MYDFVPREFCWPSMAKDIYTTVSNGSACTRDWVERKLKRLLYLFHTSGLLATIAIFNPGPLPYTTDGSQNVVFMSERWSKIIQTLLTGTTSSAPVVYVFSETWMVPCGRPGYALTEKRMQFTVLLLTPCTLLAFKLLTTTAYQTQTNR